MEKYRVIIDFWDKTRIEKTFYNKTTALQFFYSYPHCLSRIFLHFNGLIWDTLKYDVP